MRKILDYKPITDDQQARLLSQSMPQGLVWDSKGNPDSNLYKLLRSLATEINALEEKIYEMVTQWDINQTVDLISEWETAVGIPDECRNTAEDIATRRADVISKLKKVPVITIADYEALAQTITQTFTIESRFLVSHWKMNDKAANTNVRDSSSKNHTGAASVNTDTVGFSVPGKINQALDMAGIRFVVVPHDSDFNFTDGLSDKAFSISCWVTAPASTSSLETLVAKANSSIDGEWMLRREGASGAILFHCIDSDGDGINVSTSALGAGTYHVVATYDGSGTKEGMNIYIDAVLDNAAFAELGTYDGMTAGVLNVSIGTEADLQNIWKDQIDDVRIYDKELDTAEVLALNNSGDGTEDTVISPTLTPDDPLVFNIRPGSDDFPADPIYKFILLVTSPTVTSAAFDYPLGSGFESGIGLNRSGTTVTATVTDTSTMVNGGKVVIAGANQPDFNGTHVITGIPLGTTFTYEAAGVAGAATGTITVNFGIDQTQLDLLAANSQFIFDEGTVFTGYPFGGSFRTDILKCVFRKVTPANVDIVFD